jgi:cytochrome c6
MRTIFLSATAILLTACCLAPLYGAESATGDPKKGSEIFQRLQCFTCHPSGGNIINPQRPLKGKEFAKRYAQDTQIAALIRRGSPGTAMPGFSTDRLSDTDMVDLTAYIRSLSGSSKQQSKR